MSKTDETLPDDIDALKAMIAALTADKNIIEQELQNRDLVIEKLRFQLAGLRRDKFGASSEQLDQIELALEAEEVRAAANSDLPVPDAQPNKQHPGRKPLPDTLPREDVVLTPGDYCDCGGALKTLGEDITEELEYVPGHYKVNRYIRPRMACKTCEQISQADLPSRPIDKGRPGPGLLAHILVSKYADHLPLYRQSAMLQRDGIDIDRSTLAHWVGKSARLLEPLSDALQRHVLAGQAIFTDDTPVDVLAPGSGKTKTARLWSYARDERPWAGGAAPAVWYQFSADRKADHPKQHLKDYAGFMHADGYAGYRAICETGKVTEVACMAHIRRKFHDVWKADGNALAKEALDQIAALYAVEKDARHKPPDQRQALRQQESRPLLDDFEAWCHRSKKTISGKSPLAAAIRYALSRMKHVRPYLGHGILELDNNTAERSMRAIAIGRKNYLFMGSAGGGKSAAILYSLLETCKLNDVNPQAWLTDVLARIPDHKINRVDALLPWNMER